MEEPESDLTTLLWAFERNHASLPEHVGFAQRLIDVLPVPVFFKGRDGNYLGVNKKWEEFFGLSRDLILGRNSSYLYAHAPSIGAQHDSMDGMLWTQPGRQSYEIALTMLDGRFFYTLYHQASFADPEGNASGLIGTIIDVTDQRRAEHRQFIEHAVMRFLGEAQSLGDAIRGILQVMCERLGWVCAARWRLDDNDNRLHCVETWSIDEAAIRKFQEEGARNAFLPGRHGLIREVLATGKSWWIPDVSEKRDFLRAPLAAEARLRAAFALPITFDNRVIGALEFFSRETRAEDLWLLQTAMSVGGQLGQLMARREAEATTRESEARFRSLTELSSDWYWEQDEELRFTIMSGGVGNTLKVSAEAFLGKHRWDIEMVGLSSDAIDAHRAVLAAGKPFQDFEYGRVDVNGHLHHLSVSGRPILDEQGRFKGYRGVGKDITQRKAGEEALRLAHSQLERQANFDALTGLPNRHLLNDRLKQTMFVQRERRSVALVFIDLDDFKAINDSFGHDFGDEVLRGIGGRLQSALREADTVARVGGDEFVLLLNDQPYREMIACGIRRIIEKISAPMLVAGRETVVTCSVGISLYPDDGPDLQSLLRNADSAMYRAKSHGRNTFQFFTADTGERR